MPRLTAWNVLRNGTRGLRDVDRFAAHAALEPRDRALVRRLVGTEIRRRATLHALVHAFTHKKPNADVAAHLRLGFVQLFLLDAVAAHAAVSETVGAAHRTCGPGKARFVNAVLRSAQRAVREGTSGDPRRDLVGRELHFEEPVFRDPAEHPLLWAEDALSMPAPLLKRWSARYGEEQALALARLALDEPPLSVRIAAPEGERPAALDELAALEPRASEHPDVVLVDAGRTEELLQLDAFRAGRVTVQGGTALRAAELCEAQPGERVLELAAAPGGKTAVLAGAGAHVVACDVSPSRLARLGETVARLGLGARVSAVTSDGAAAFLETTAFDAVLVDVPCSNTGVLAQRPEARWRYGPSTQRSLRELQTRLLGESAARVRPGGRLVYSTCSLEPEENAQAVRTFLREREADAPGVWTLEAERDALPDHETGPVDGGYAARLRRA